MRVWHDSRGYYTCPPDAAIGASSPPVCAVEVGDRVRLEGDVLAATIPWTPPGPGGDIPRARITGTVRGTGYTIEIDKVTPT
jgi:hypothetical protein